MMTSAVFELVGLLLAVCAVPERDRERRREALDLAHPVGDDAGRRHDERAARCFSSCFTASRSAMVCTRLAETHVVGEHAARADVVDELQPREALLLVGAQRRLEAARLLGGLDLVDRLRAS